MPLTEASSIRRSPRPWLCLNGLDTRLLGPSEGNVYAFINFVHSCWRWREKQAYSPNCNATSGSVKISNSLKYAGYFRLRGCAQNQDTGMSRQILMAGKDDVTWSQVKNSWQMQPIKVKGAVPRNYQNSNRGNRHKTEYSMKITAHNKKITPRMQREPNNRQTWRRLKRIAIVLSENLMA